MSQFYITAHLEYYLCYSVAVFAFRIGIIRDTIQLRFIQLVEHTVRTPGPPLLHVA